MRGRKINLPTAKGSRLQPISVVEIASSSTSTAPHNSPTSTHSRRKLRLGLVQSLFRRVDRRGGKRRKAMVPQLHRTCARAEATARYGTLAPGDGDPRSAWVICRWPLHPYEQRARRFRCLLSATRRHHADPAKWTAGMALCASTAPQRPDLNRRYPSGIQSRNNHCGFPVPRCQSFQS
jgi:hypothetical protein